MKVSGPEEQVCLFGPLFRQKSNGRGEYSQFQIQFREEENGIFKE